MAYNDVWRVYEDISVYTEKRNILLMAKLQLEKQLAKQQERVRKISEKTRRLTLNNSTKRRRVVANMRLSEECNYRDMLERRLNILNEWMKEIEEDK